MYFFVYTICLLLHIQLWKAIELVRLHIFVDWELFEEFHSELHFGVDCPNDVIESWYTAKKRQNLLCSYYKIERNEKKRRKAWPRKLLT